MNPEKIKELLSLVLTPDGKGIKRKAAALDALLYELYFLEEGDIGYLRAELAKYIVDKK